MSYRINFVLDSFDDYMDPQLMIGTIDALARSLMLANINFLSQNLDTPLLYESGVYYKPEDGEENFFDIPRVLRDGHADCEDLSAWRAAELTILGMPSYPFTTYAILDNGDLLFHVRVMTPRGVEDPSQLLGM